MKLEFKMVKEFGDFLADGHLGNQFRCLRVESVWSRVELVTFDFAGVTNLTDSFVHACFGNMAEEHGEEFLGKIRGPRGCGGIGSFTSATESAGDGMQDGARRNRRGLGVPEVRGQQAVPGKAAAGCTQSKGRSHSTRRTMAKGSAASEG